MVEKIRILMEPLTKKLSENINIEKVYLFGSYAYGDPDINSDIDICVLSEVKKRKIELIQEIYSLLYDIDFPLDVLVYREQEFYERAKSKTSIENEIFEKGIVVYG